MAPSADGSETVMTVDRLYEIADETPPENLDVQAVMSGLPITGRADLASFLLLDRICPGSVSILAAAGHDQVWLGIPLDVFAKAATEEQARVLFHHYGIFIDEDALAMFV